MANDVNHYLHIGHVVVGLSVHILHTPREVLVWTVKGLLKLLTESGTTSSSGLRVYEGAASKVTSLAGI